MIRKLPSAYVTALAAILPPPKMVTEALRLYYTTEGPGSMDNPVILGWAKELGLSGVYSHDSVPWCGLFVALVAKRAGKEPVANPLWAMNWRNFGTEVQTPMLGDVLVKTRKTASGTIAGHVCIVLGEDGTHYHVIGGNQSDKVCITRIPKSSKLWFRRPPYKVKPASVRSIIFPADAATAGGSEA